MQFSCEKPSDFVDLIVSIALAAVATICLFLILTIETRAQNHEGHHGHDHAKLHPWYRTLMRPDVPGSSCCNEQDCRPTTAKLVDGKWIAKVDGEWITIPESKINREESVDTQAHVCAPLNKTHYPPGFVFCFVKPGFGL